MGDYAKTRARYFRYAKPSHSISQALSDFAVVWKGQNTRVARTLRRIRKVHKGLLVAVALGLPTDDMPRRYHFLKLRQDSIDNPRFVKKLHDER